MYAINHQRTTQHDRGTQVLAWVSPGAPGTFGLTPSTPTTEYLSNPVALFNPGLILSPPRSYPIIQGGRYQDYPYDHPRSALFPGVIDRLANVGSPNRRWFFGTQELPFHPSSVFVPAVVRDNIINYIQFIRTTQEVPYHPASWFFPRFPTDNVRPETPRSFFGTQEQPLHPSSVLVRALIPGNLAIGVTQTILTRQENPEATKPPTSVIRYSLTYNKFLGAKNYLIIVD